jgi:quercetin dioxygenase-like cupin family protein
MKILSPESRPTQTGPADWFTGTVHIDPIVNNDLPSRLRAARVSFAPGARTAWHTHPLGQTLHVLSGVGLVQLHGQLPQIIRPGDTVSILPDELHWHGAAPTHAMVHLALQEANENNVQVVWLQHVTDEEYAVPPGAV